MELLTAFVVHPVVVDQPVVAKIQPVVVGIQTVVVIDQPVAGILTVAVIDQPVAGILTVAVIAQPVVVEVQPVEDRPCTRPMFQEGSAQCQQERQQ